MGISEGGAAVTVGQWYVRRGRITRRTYWLHYTVPIIAAQLLAAVLDLALGLATTQPASGEGWVFSSTAGPIGIVVTLAAIVPSVASLVTRLHDRGHSAWWLSWAFVPLVGAILLFVQTGFLRGDGGPNRYGPPARQPTGDPLSA
jgi:uncharacterized membrane protein YhaH (DUF805 family)